MAFLKQFYFFLFPMIMVTSCGALKGTVISGNLSGAENMTVYLDGVSITQQSNIILQEKIGADGKFKLSFPDGVKKGVYRLRIGEQVGELIMDGSEKDVTISGKLTDLNEFAYTVTGSKLTEQYLKAVRDI